MSGSLQHYGWVILAGIAAGMAARIVMLRNDYRNYPNYPHGYVTHLTLGFIASALGAVAVPAIAKPDFVAVTFLALAAQQFREIRNMERETLSQLEASKLLKRGKDYIEGIARVFEARNYLSMISALLTAGAWHWIGPWASLPVAMVCVVLCLWLMSGRQVGQIARLEPGHLHFERSLLMIDDVVIMNVALAATRQKILDEGMALLFHPKDDNARLALDAPGQRQAIIHDVVSILGSKVDISEPDLTPLMRKHPDKGYYALYIICNEPDLECLMEVVRRSPVLETAEATALKSRAGKKAAD